LAPLSSENRSHFQLGQICTVEPERFCAQSRAAPDASYMLRLFGVAAASDREAADLTHGTSCARRSAMRSGNAMATKRPSGPIMSIVAAWLIV